jgi:hypothetical protein
MGSDYPCQLSLKAIIWEPKNDETLLPSYAAALTTISQLALISGLSLSDVLRSGVGFGTCLMPFAPIEGFSPYIIDPEDLTKDRIERGLKESGPDWLGLYRYIGDAPAGIELHLSRCRKTAEFLGVSVRDLVEVVWTHEAAHFVSHVGIGGFDRTIWENFQSATSDDKEYAAQSMCWAAFAVFRKSKLIRVMKKLSKYQSEKYNTWKGFEKYCAERDPLHIIQESTSQIGSRSGRKVTLGRGDLHDIVGYDC